MFQVLDQSSLLWFINKLNEKDKWTTEEMRLLVLETHAGVYQSEILKFNMNRLTSDTIYGQPSGICVPKYQPISPFKQYDGTVVFDPDKNYADHLRAKGYTVTEPPAVTDVGKPVNFSSSRKTR